MGEFDWEGAYAEEVSAQLIRLATGGCTARLLVDVQPARVAAAVADLVERGNRHVRVPRRGALAGMIAELPRRAVEALLSGIDHRTPPGASSD